ncbi:ABC transporter substrate-binding protein [Pseudochelatococcus contaminans]|uniref:Iron(III) transport system substrate-binding protein n=1 Tax=Pseudochelatococcus contaminans TaxID=1538103 RepID=A0A7W5Z512_9HYPH|nr:ABC transporter substrate-binding protein [Pseudochelatococcus contaminans]MBB3809970.1 iron(III) transport system substrate-binding protein [Pseudochelatococcus contaminans]
MKSVLAAVIATLSSAVAVVPAAFAADNVSGKLVLYTSQPNTDAQQTIDAFKAKHPNVDISFVRDGTPPLLAKLRAEFEAGQPQPDVLLIADSVTLEGLKKEGRLQPHEAADVSAYPPGTHDPDKNWFSTKLITTGIAYNTKADFKPTSWEDLKRPEVKGQLIMPSPLASGAALIHAATLTGNLPEGWGYYEALKQNDALAAGGNGGVLKAVAGGDKLYGVIVDYMPIREKAKGAPIEFVFPVDGVSAVTEPVAILKTAKNPEAAKAFVDFILSQEGQDLARQQGYIPAHPEVALPEGFPARSTIKVLSFDPAKALEDEAKNKKEFADIFGQ